MPEYDYCEIRISHESGVALVTIKPISFKIRASENKYFVEELNELLDRYINDTQ